MARYILSGQPDWDVNPWTGQPALRGYAADGSGVVFLDPSADEFRVDDGSGTQWANTGGGETKTTYDPTTGAVTGVYDAPVSNTSLSAIWQDQIQPTVQGAIEATQTPEFQLAALLAGGLNYGLTGSVFTGAPADAALGLESALSTPVAAAPVQYAAIPGAVTDAPVYDVLASGAPATGGADMFPFLTDPAFIAPEAASLVPNIGTAAVLGGAAAGAGGSATAGASSLPTAAATGAAAAGTGAVVDGSIGGGDNSDYADNGSTHPDNLNTGAQDAAVTGAASAGTAAALARIMRGEGTLEDFLSVGGVGAATGLGVVGSMQQADTFRRLAEQARADRAPFLGKSLEWLSNPTAYAEGPGKAFMDATLRRLSATHGNPIDSPTAMGLATQAGLQDWRGAVTGFGNLGLAGEDTRASLGTREAGADANVFNAIGSGIADLTTQRTPWEQFLRQMGGGANARLA